MGIGIIELVIILAVLGLIGAIVAGLVLSLATRRPGGLSGNNPNLRPCPDCGHFISVRAAACPHCGGPVKGG
jgi:hypothetical protein